jgi:hypothetical protein
MKQSWETVTYVENRDPMHPLIIRLEETSEEDEDSDGWSFRV